MFYNRDEELSFLNESYQIKIIKPLMLYQDYLGTRGREVRACAGYGGIGFPEPTLGVQVVVQECVLRGIGHECYRPY